MWRVGTNAEAAFTFLEALVVLIILSLVSTAAALTLPDAGDRARLSRAGAWVDSLLVETRGLARREGRAHAIEFDPDARQYRRGGASWTALPSGVAWSVEGGRRMAAGTTVITFLSDRTGSGGTIALRAGRMGATRRIDRLTGAIRHGKE